MLLAYSVDPSIATLVIVPLFTIAVTNVLGYMKTRVENKTALDKAAADRKADREDADQKRRWDKEDLENKAKMLAATVTVEADRVKAESQKRSDVVLRQIAAVDNKIDENTELTKTAVAKAGDAYQEANSVNTKIADLHERQLATEKKTAATIETDKLATAEQADRIEATGEDSNKRVKHLESKQVGKK